MCVYIIPVFVYNRMHKCTECTYILLAYRRGSKVKERARCGGSIGEDFLEPENHTRKMYCWKPKFTRLKIHFNLHLLHRSEYFMLCAWNKTERARLANEVDGIYVARFKCRCEFSSRTLRSSFRVPLFSFHSLFSQSPISLSLPLQVCFAPQPSRLLVGNFRTVNFYAVRWVLAQYSTRIHCTSHWNRRISASECIRCRQMVAKVHIHIQIFSLRYTLCVYLMLRPLFCTFFGFTFFLIFNVLFFVILYTSPSFCRLSKDFFSCKFSTVCRCAYQANAMGSQRNYSKHF